MLLKVTPTIHSHIHYAKDNIIPTINTMTFTYANDTPYSTYIHIFIISKKLPTIYYIHSQIH